MCRVGEELTDGGDGAAHTLRSMQNFVPRIQNRHVRIRANGRRWQSLRYEATKFRSQPPAPATGVRAESRSHDDRASYRATASRDCVALLSRIQIDTVAFEA